MSIGSKIKFFRQQKRMTQQELGESVGFSKPSAGVRIAQYESGVRTPKDFTLEEIANALLVSPDASCQGLFNQIQEKVTFCGLPPGADA